MKDILTKKDIGKTYDFWKNDYDFVKSDNFLMSVILVEIKDNKPYFILEKHNVKMLGISKPFDCDFYKLYFVEAPIKQKSEKQIKAILKKSHTPDQVMFHRNGEWKQGEIEENNYGHTDDLWLSYYSYNYQAKTLKDDDWDKSYFLTDTDVKEKIKILTLVHNEGELSDDLLIDFEYNVNRFEVKNQKILGYYITHKDTERYIPKECTTNTTKNISNKIDNLTENFANNLDENTPCELKFLLIENFKNSLEIERLKTNHEIAKIKNYLYEDNFKMMGEALVGINEKIDSINDKIDKNLSLVMKKITTIENNFDKKIDDIKKQMNSEFKEHNSKLYWLGTYTTAAYNKTVTETYNTVKPFEHPIGPPSEEEILREKRSRRPSPYKTGNGWW